MCKEFCGVWGDNRVREGDELGGKLDDVTSTKDIVSRYHLLYM